MANGFDRIVSYTLNLISATVGSPTVSIPAIITDEAPAGAGNFGSGYAKLYKINELSSVETDFSDSGVTYKAASALAAVSPKVNSFYVIKRATPVAAVVTLVFDDVIVTGNTIAGTVNGEAISQAFNTSNAQTLTDLASDIQALEMVATAVSDGTDTITITFETQWEPAVGTFTVTGGASQAECVTTVVTPATNIRDDIANAMGEADTNLWFMLLPTTTNKGAILAAADYVESLSDLKMLLVHSTDSAIYTAGSTDVASKLEAAGYDRTAIIYHDDSTEMVHCRWASRCLSRAPGAGTWANRKLTGATAAPRTSAEITILEGKNANSYTAAGPAPLTRKGVVASGKAIEFVRDSFYAINELNTELYNLFSTAEKIPYNSQGKGLIQSAGDAVVKRMKNEGVFNPESDTPAQWIVTEPADISSSDKTARLWPDNLLVAEHLRAVISIDYNANISG